MRTTVKDRTDERLFFALWALVGAGVCLAVLSLLTIGIFVAAAVTVAAWMLLRSTGATRSMAGAVSGVSLMLFFVAWTNRDGPGVVCTVRPTSTHCGEQWNPWPWLVAGVAFLSVGIALFYVLGRVRTSAGQGLTPP